MRWPAAARPSISAAEDSVVAAGLRAPPLVACTTWRAISWIEAVSSSDAAATVLTLFAVSSEADAADPVWSAAFEATPVRVCAVDAHHLGILSDRAERLLDRDAERLDRAFDMRVARLARLHLVGDGAIEFAVAPHRFLEHADRARQRADLVLPAGMRNDHIGAAGDLLRSRA